MSNIATIFLNFILHDVTSYVFGNIAGEFRSGMGFILSYTLNILLNI